MKKILVLTLCIVMMLSTVVCYAVGGVKGTVTDSNGNPIEGATITLGNGTTTGTDASGSYLMTRITADGYTITVQADGYITAEKTVAIEDRTRKVVDFTLELEDTDPVDPVDPVDPDKPYTIVDTAQNTSYDDEGNEINPSTGDAFYGQDADYTTNVPVYVDNGDGTVTDKTTGLMWQQDAVAKQTYDDAVEGAANCTLGTYEDWRMPTIKELYSLINFNGNEGSMENPDENEPFIDDEYFTYYLGSPRYIDAQFMSATKYVSLTMDAKETGGDETVFGVNFVDGRIKGYPVKDPITEVPNEYYTIYVRDNEEYGKNDFVDNEDGTITDNATGLMWMQVDSGSEIFDVGENGAMDWESALEWAENLSYAGYDDWKLPDAKELQSIVDYTRSPDTTNSAAIDPLFDCTVIKMEGTNEDGYGYYWTSTTHKTGPADVAGNSAAYIAFGEGFGYFEGEYQDVHGAGVQRSDPKSGDPSDYPVSFGPQGDIQRVFNFVRCVRIADEGQ